MIRSILKITFFAAVLLLANPGSVRAESSVAIVDNSEIDVQNIDITIHQNVLRVSGASGQIMRIYKVTGVGVMTVKVDGDEKSYTLNLSKGCYIVRIGNVIRKIFIT